MRRKFHAVLASLLAMVFIFSLAACGKPALSIDPDDFNLEVGSSQTLEIYEGETKLESKDFEWKSDKETVARVDENGRVSARGEGTANITATMKSDSSRTATAKVTVKPREVVGVTLKDANGNEITAASVDMGSDITVKAETTNGSTVSWSTSSSHITVTADGNTATIHGVLPTDNEPAIVTVTSGGTRKELAVTVNALAGMEFYNLGFAAEGATQYEDGTPVKEDEFFYWSARAEWGQQQVDVEYAYYQDGKVSFKYTSDWDPGYSYGFQLFYKNSKHTLGTTYVLTCTIEIDQDCRVSLNGNLVDLTKGKNDLKVTYKYTDSLGSGAHYGVSSFDLVMGYDDGTATGYFVKDATVTVSNVEWKEDVPEQLQAPSFTYSNATGVITITDPNKEGVGSYRLNFYKADGTLAGAVAVVSGEVVNTSKIPNGSYTAKLVAVSNNAHWLDSEESATSVDITVANESIHYDLEGGGKEAAAANPGEWRYWTSNWVAFTGSYTDGQVDVEFSNNAGNWYDTQLAYREPTAEVGKYYDVTLTITSNAAGKITVNGEVVTLTAGTDDYTTKGYLQLADGATIVIVFGLDGQDNQQDIKEGKISIVVKEIKPGEAKEPNVPTPDPAVGNLPYGEEGSAEGAWVYWNAVNQNGCTVTVSEANVTTNNDGTFGITAKFSSVGNLDYGFQLFHNDKALYPNGTTVTVTFKVTSSVNVKITVNGTPYTLAANTPTDVEVTRVVNYTGNYNGQTLFSMQVVVADGTSYELTLANVKFAASSAEVKPTEPANPGDYELSETVVTPKSGATMGADPQDEAYSLGGGLDNWVYWYVSGDNWEGCGTRVTMNTHTLDNGTVTLGYTGGSVGFSVQLFYSSSELTKGKTYFLTAKVNASVAGAITINGVSYTLKEGDNNVAVVFVLNETGAENNGISAVDFQFPGTEGVTKTYKVSDVTWREVLNTNEAGGDQGGSTVEPSETNVSLRLVDAYGQYFFYFEATTSVDISTADHVTLNGNTVQWTEYTNQGNGTFAFKVQVPSHDAGTYTFRWYNAGGSVIATAVYVHA